MLSRSSGAVWARAWLAGLALLTPATAFGANQSGISRALTIRALGIVKTADLDFGIMTRAGGTVTIDAQTGARTAAGGAVLAGGTPAPGRFTIAGTPGRVITVALNPNNNLVLNRIGGGASMTVGQFRASYDGSNSSPMGPNQTVPADGTTVMSLGGRLNIGNNQAEGIYEGTFTVTVDYQ